MSKFAPPTNCRPTSSRSQRPAAAQLTLSSSIADRVAAPCISPETASISKAARWPKSCSWAHPPRVRTNFRVKLYIALIFIENLHSRAAALPQGRTLENDLVALDVRQPHAASRGRVRGALSRAKVARESDADRPDWHPSKALAAIRPHLSGSRHRPASLVTVAS